MQRATDGGSHDDSRPAARERSRPARDPGAAARARLRARLAAAGRRRTAANAAERARTLVACHDGDTAIRVLAAIVVLAVAAFAAIVSYSHIFELGFLHGQTAPRRRLLPLSR